MQFQEQSRRQLSEGPSGEETHAFTFDSVPGAFKALQSNRTSQVQMKNTSGELSKKKKSTRWRQSHN